MKRITVFFMLFVFAFVFGVTVPKQITITNTNLNSYFVEKNYKVKIEYPKGILIDTYA